MLNEPATMVSEPVTIDALRAAIETRDVTTLIGFYRRHAVLRIIDVNNPPSRPLELRGRSAIAAHFEDVCGRDMTHRIESAVADINHVSLVQLCAYPNGSRVACHTMMDLDDGAIIRQVILQVWDT